MKTLLLATPYTAMVATMDLGGALWANLHAVHSGKTVVVATAPVHHGSENGKRNSSDRNDSF